MKKKIILGSIVFLFMFVSIVYAVGMDDNTTLNAYRIAENSSSSITKMKDGLIDAFVDESGIDTTDSGNNVLGDGTKLLLSFDGTDGATSVNDDSGNGHTITFNGDAQLDTAATQFGGSSLLLDGNGDYVSIADSAGWDFTGSNTDNWTIDFWVKHNTHSGNNLYVGQDENSGTGNRWQLNRNDSSGLRFFLQVDSVLLFDFNSGSGNDISDSNWHHLALIKVGDEYGIYKDGTQVAYVQDSDTHSFAAPLRIGRQQSAAAYLDGHIDDFRIARANLFNAFPNSSKTDTFEVPTLAHDTTDGFNSYSPKVDNDMTLISQIFTAEDVPTDAKVVILEEDVDSVTTGTDLTVKVSRGGEYSASITLTDEGYYSNGNRILTGTVDLSSLGTTETDQLQYKIETANSKDLRIHGVGLSWE